MNAFSPEVRRGGGLPYAQVCNQWTCDPRYSTNLRTLYAILVSYADVRSRDTAKGKPYRAALAAQLGVSLKTLDRTVDEGEAAGLFTVTRRPGAGNQNDANVYDLHDHDVPAGEWDDPLGPGEKAADVAKRLTAERVAAKKDAGYVHKGGRTKQDKTPVDHGVDNQGGGVTHDATPSVTHDAGVASPVTPYVFNPVQNHYQDPQSLPSAVGARSVTPANEAPAAGDADQAPGTGQVRENPSDPRGSEPYVDEVAARRGRAGGPLRGEEKTSSSIGGQITATAPALQALAPVWALLGEMSRPQRVMALKAVDVLVGPCRRDAAELAATLEARYAPMSGSDEHGTRIITAPFGWLRAELGRLDMTACARCSRTSHGSPFHRPLCAKCETFKAQQEARKGWTAADFEKDAAQAERVCQELARRLEASFEEDDLAVAWEEAHGTIAGHQERGGAATPSLFDVA